MAKVKQKAGKYGGANAITRGAQAAKQQQAAKQKQTKHKIAVQTNNNEKQLPTVVAFTEEPPIGYTFVRSGDPRLTNALKDFAKRANEKIYAVTITPHAERHELSREIHRVGFHFPTHVVAAVCHHYDIRINSKGELEDEHRDAESFKSVYESANGKPGKEPPMKKDQKTINTEAKDNLQDLFPNIPEKDMFRIIKTAFQLGDGKVGTAFDVAPLRRAQLAVVAHIRHNYTNYDKLLRKMPYNDARHQIEAETLAKIIEWRGDETSANAKPGNADELLKDVIVISDAEASDSEVDDVRPLPREQVRVEEIPSSRYAPRRSLSPAEQYEERHYHELPFRPYRQEVVARRVQTRLDRFAQAQQVFRTRGPLETRRYEPEPPVTVTRQLIPLDPPNQPIHRVHDSQATMTHTEYEPLPPRRAEPPTYIRGVDGALYEKVEDRPRQPRPEVYYERDGVAVTRHLVRTRPSSPQPFRQPANDLDLADISDGMILPSIEGPDTMSNPSRRPNPFDGFEEPRSANPGGRIGRQPDVEPNIVTTNGQASNRRRLEETTDRLVYREASPLRAPQVQYRVPRDDRTEGRVVQYGEQRSSPRMQTRVMVREDPLPRQSYYDDRDPSRPVVRAYEPLPISREPQQPTRPLYSSQNYVAVSRNDRDAGFAASIQSLPPHTVPITRAYDSRTGAPYGAHPREAYVQPSADESRARFVYVDQLQDRQPLREAPPRLVEYSHTLEPSLYAR